MCCLSPQVQKVVFACKGHSRPTIFDFDRVWSALALRLFDMTFLRGESPQVAGPNGMLQVDSSRVVGLVAVCLALVLGGVAVYVSRVSEPRSSSTTTAAMMAAPANDSSEAAQQPSSPSDEMPSTAPPIAELKNAPNRAPGAVRPQEPARNRDNFAQEVALLPRAEAELNRGNPVRTMELLNEHERRFANGALIEERMAARIQALCAL